MRKNNYLFGLMVLLFSYEVISAQIPQKEDLKAYLTFSYRQPLIAIDNVSQSLIERKIINTFIESGVRIVLEDVEEYKLHIDVVEEHKIYIYITLSDSLFIEANSISISYATMVRRYPRVSATYKDEFKILSAIKKYIEKNITENNRE